MRSYASVILAFTTAALLGAAPVAGPPLCRADAVAYLVNVTVRPGYNFAGPDDALAYGRQVCDKVAGGGHFAQLVHDVKTDLNTSDEYQATYLVSQAVNELCPALIWQLRNSATGAEPPASNHR